MVYSATRSNPLLIAYFHFLIFPFFPILYRQNTVEDLVKLARQFDKNMQDRESLEGVHNDNNNFDNSLSDRPNTSKPKLRSADKMKDLQCSSSSDRVEEELQTLFNCSTQKVSGRLSQASSACSQDVKDKPAAAHLVEARQSRPKPSTTSVPAAGVEATALGSNNDFDDDWENDDLLNDPLLLEITQNTPRLLDESKTTLQSNTNAETHQSCSGFQLTTKTVCARQPSAAHSKLTCSALQELCHKPKTTNRSTFKLEPNPHFQAKNPSKPKPQIALKNWATKTLGQPDKTTDSKSDTCDAADSIQAISDSLWDDGDDDTLLYQVCDTVERISNTPVPIDTVTSSTKREAPRTFVRSNSFPATSGGAVNYRGWDVPVKGANNKSQMSQSLPGSHVVLGTFNQSRDSSGKFQTASDAKACMVTAKTSHTSFKRNFSDSAVTSNKGKRINSGIEHFKEYSHFC